MTDHPTTTYDDPWSEVADRVTPELTVVALGGGHGLAANLSALRTFVTDQGRILPRKYTGLPAHYQRRLNTAIKRARQMLLMK